jgi:hypothetical protein
VPACGAGTGAGGAEVLRGIAWTVVVVALVMAHRQPVVEDIRTARLAANGTHHPPMSGGAPRVDAAR